MYGYREIGGHCVACMTFDEALELALIYADASGIKQHIEGDLIQHVGHYNITKEHQYCWHVTALGESIGIQGSKGKARSNGRAAR